MGCQNSRLSFISNSNVEAKPQSGSAQQSKKPKSKSKLYEDKQNTGSCDEIHAKEKARIPLQFNVKTNDRPNSSPQEFSQGQLQMVAEVIQRLEDFQCQGKERRQNLQRAKSRQDFEKYFAQVLKIIKNKQFVFKKIIQQASHKYQCTFGKRVTNEHIDRIIQHYLSKNMVAYSEAQKWVKGRIVILRIKGQVLAKWVKEICGDWQQDKELIPELLHLSIEDSMVTGKSFAIKLAIQYQYKNILEQVQQWQTEMAQLYLKLRQVIV